MVRPGAAAVGKPQEGHESKMSISAVYLVSNGDIRGLLDPPFCFEAKLQLLYTLCYIESEYCLRPSYRIVPPVLSCHTLIIITLHDP
jgi:hypothetical protein